MKKILLVIMSLAFVNVALAKSKNSDRKPADTHGGVLRANAAFAAVASSNYGAQPDGAGLFRTLAVTKKLDCGDNVFDIFEGSYGNVNDLTGKEKVTEKMLLMATSAPTEDSELNFRVSRYTGSCK